ncbi:hypothetical protein GGS21DRAFT_435490 [Xylaria nigripes]|nr:hypothetical protein GGS21DRAFT_435490 [Xylaria nigripes]
MAEKPVPEELNSQTTVPTSANQNITHPSATGPGRCGRLYHEDKRPPLVQFQFCPDPSRLWELDRQDWLAHLQLKCSDVPRLMREGFSLDDSNVIKEEGYLEYRIVNHKGRSPELAPARWYFFADTHQSQLWVASLYVKATNATIIYNFDLRQLSRELVRYAFALNQSRQYIYEYQAHTCYDGFFRTPRMPMKAFNMIYHKMPMEGLWPWPRKENEADTKSHAEKGAHEKVASGSSQPHSFQDTRTSKEARVNGKK